ncbi:MAG: 50S ribosomal protein L24 [Deltaproteobacteria bacterium CG11_big_fil_rev_8_21_14_0_20_45_16]|nr:MAG: 50S ribosomal protein L24 [Deltaproteobacteria bacterium CG11_big_fil_rev_8_21_14_0_20_45_16]
MQRVRKDDLVQIITGKDKGRSGKVLQVFPKEHKCIVEGTSVVKKHQKATQAGTPAGIVEKTLKIDLCKVMPIDSKTKKPTRVRFNITGEKKARQSAAGGTIDSAAKV